MSYLKNKNWLVNFLLAFLFLSVKSQEVYDTSKYDLAVGIRHSYMEFKHSESNNLVSTIGVPVNFIFGYKLKTGKVQIGIDYTRLNMIYYDTSFSYISSSKQFISIPIIISTNFRFNENGKILYNSKSTYPSIDLGGGVYFSKLINEKNQLRANLIEVSSSNIVVGLLCRIGIKQSFGRKFNISSGYQYQKDINKFQTPENRVIQRNNNSSIYLDFIYGF